MQRGEAYLVPILTRGLDGLPTTDWPTILMAVDTSDFGTGPTFHRLKYLDQDTPVGYVLLTAQQTANVDYGITLFVYGNTILGQLIYLPVVQDWTAQKAAYIDQAISAPKALTAAYDAAKTAAQPGDAMTLVVEALDADRMTDDAVARIQHDALDRLDEIDGDIQRLAESVSGGTGANDVSFCVRDQAGSPVVGAVIRLYADAQRSTLAYWGIASAAGRLTFHLPDGTYYPTVIAWGVRTDYDPISVGGQ